MRDLLYFLTCVWVFILGGLLIIHLGISCIIFGITTNCSTFIAKPSVFMIGIVSLAITFKGLAILKKKLSINESSHKEERR